MWMGYYPILDRTPQGRDEGRNAFQTWLRRHDEYGRERRARPGERLRQAS
jgi:predicted dithiol-disulfide oxidoreductase (DUF899 family)